MKKMFFPLELLFIRLKKISWQHLTWGMCMVVGNVLIVHNNYMYHDLPHKNMHKHPFSVLSFS